MTNCPRTNRPCADFRCDPELRQCRDEIFGEEPEASAVVLGVALILAMIFIMILKVVR